MDHSQFDPTVSWKDVEWIRSIWPGKLVLKGILDPEDAREALKTGADGVVVSNHGGRQLDGAPSTISALPKVADAIGGQKEILIDSRDPHRPGHFPRARARRQCLHDRPRIPLWPRRAAARPASRRRSTSCGASSTPR